MSRRLMWGTKWYPRSQLAVVVVSTASMAIPRVAVKACFLDAQNCEFGLPIISYPPNKRYSYGKLTPKLWLFLFPGMVDKPSTSEFLMPTELS